MRACKCAHSTTPHSHVANASVRLSVCLSVCLFVRLSVNLPVCLFVCMCVCVCVCAYYADSNAERAPILTSVARTQTHNVADDDDSDGHDNSQDVGSRFYRCVDSLHTPNQTMWGAPGQAFSFVCKPSSNRCMSVCVCVCILDAYFVKSTYDRNLR